MRQYELDVGTQYGTIISLPANRSFDIYGYIASNSGTQADTIHLSEITYDQYGTVTGTVSYAPIVVPAEDSKSQFNEEHPVIIMPPSGYVVAYSSLGTSFLSLKADLVYRQV